ARQHAERILVQEFCYLLIGSNSHRATRHIIAQAIRKVKTDVSCLAVGICNSHSSVHRAIHFGRDSGGRKYWRRRYTGLRYEDAALPKIEDAEACGSRIAGIGLKARVPDA